eukprot:38337-Chlamydomonas_euryale.AAC.1
MCPSRSQRRAGNTVETWGSRSRDNLCAGVGSGQGKGGKTSAPTTMRASTMSSTIHSWSTGQSHPQSSWLHWSSSISEPLLTSAGTEGSRAATVPLLPFVPPAPPPAWRRAPAPPAVCFPRGGRGSIRRAVSGAAALQVRGWRQLAGPSEAGTC